MKKHWTIFAVFIVAAILAATGAVYVFVWFTGYSQSTGLVPSTLNLWSMNNLVLFILYAIFWELVMVGIPVAIGAMMGWLWWKRLQKQKERISSLWEGLSGFHSRRSNITIAIHRIAIKVYVDGNWNAAIAGFTLDYVIGSMVTILAWIVAILAIPAIIGLVWWIRQEVKKPNLFLLLISLLYYTRSTTMTADKPTIPTKQSAS